MSHYQTRLAVLTAELERLLEARVWRLTDLRRERPPESEVKGVYLISLPEKPETVVYAGRTRTKTVRGRLADHRTMNTSSDLRGMLSRYPDLPQVPDEYGVRWIEVAEASKRGAFEVFVIAVLAPQFNRW